MNMNAQTSKADEQHGLVTKALASVCHHCGICPYANKKPDSSFGRLMAIVLEPALE